MRISLSDDSAFLWKAEGYGVIGLWGYKTDATVETVASVASKIINEKNL